MSWKIGLSRSANKFIQDSHIAKSDVADLTKKALAKFGGEDINIDIKKLKGHWRGYYRIRARDVRIIFNVNFGEREVFIEIIDKRDSAY